MCRMVRRGAARVDRMEPAEPATEHGVPFRDAAAFWIKLGFINFGGPAGQISLMHEELVERRRWISDGRFLHALNFCMLLPGPEAQQLAIYVGWLLHKVRGGILAGVAFILPAFFLIWGLSWTYAAHGDVAVIDADHYMRITDRTKDLIKSGGEWISSVDLENALMGHPAVREAAVIGVAHPKWSERPVACVVLKEGARATHNELREYLEPLFAKFQVPDAYVFMAAIPRSAAGKFLKTALREQLKDFKFES